MELFFFLQSFCINWNRIFKSMMVMLDGRDCHWIDTLKSILQVFGGTLVFCMLFNLKIYVFLSIHPFLYRFNKTYISTSLSVFMFIEIRQKSEKGDLLGRWYRFWLDWGWDDCCILDWLMAFLQNFSRSITWSYSLPTIKFVVNNDDD